MKKMKKLFFSVFALSALILSACSGSQVVDTSSTPSSSSQTPTTSVTPSESSEPEESSIPEESSSAEEESSSQEESSSSEPIEFKADYRIEIGNAVYDLLLNEGQEVHDKEYYLGAGVSKTVAAGEAISFKKLQNDEYQAFTVAPSPDDVKGLTYNNVIQDGNAYNIRAAGSVEVYLKLDGTEWSYWISGGGAMEDPFYTGYRFAYGAGESAATWAFDQALPGEESESKDEGVAKQLKFSFETDEITYGKIRNNASGDDAEWYGSKYLEKDATSEDGNILFNPGKYDIYFKLHTDDSYSIWVSAYGTALVENYYYSFGKTGEKVAFTQRYEPSSLWNQFYKEEVAITTNDELYLWVKDSEGNYSDGTQLINGVNEIASALMIPIIPEEQGDPYGIKLSIDGTYSFYFNEEVPGGLKWYLVRKEGMPTTPVMFAVEYETVDGQSLYVVGSFNDWTPSADYKLHWTEGNIWRADAEDASKGLDLPLGGKFKLVVAPTESPTKENIIAWEGGSDRLVTKDYEVDSWGVDQFFISVGGAYPAPLTKVGNPDPEENKYAEYTVKVTAGEYDSLSFYFNDYQKALDTSKWAFEGNAEGGYISVAGSVDIYLKLFAGTGESAGQTIYKVWASTPSAPASEYAATINSEAVKDLTDHAIAKDENVWAYAFELKAGDVIAFTEDEKPMSFVHYDKEQEKVVVEGTSLTADADGTYKFFYKANEGIYHSYEAPVVLTKVMFAVEYETVDGQSLYVIGDFNGWTPSADYKLHWTTGNIWRADEKDASKGLDLPLNGQFKLAVAPTENPTKESIIAEEGGLNRIVVADLSVDSWQINKAYLSVNDGEVALMTDVTSTMTSETNKYAEYKLTVDGKENDTLKLYYNDAENPISADYLTFEGNAAEGKINADGSTDIYLKLFAGTGEFEGKTVYKVWASTPTAEPIYYLVGTINGENRWNTTDATAASRAFSATAVEGEYSLKNVAFKDGDAMKVCSDGGTWYPDGDGNNHDVQAGLYDIYFRPAGNPDWNEFYFVLVPFQAEASALTFWKSKDSTYVLTPAEDNKSIAIEYNNIAGKSYQCIGTDTLEGVNKLELMTSFDITLENKGENPAKFRVDVKGTTKVGNTEAINTSAVAPEHNDIYTDLTWGGSSITLAAGEKVTFTIYFDQSTERGALTQVAIFVDSFQGDETTRSGSVELSNFTFGMKVAPKSYTLKKGGETILGTVNQVKDDDKDNRAIYQLNLTVGDKITFFDGETQLHLGTNKEALEFSCVKGGLHTIYINNANEVYIEEPVALTTINVDLGAWDADGAVFYAYAWKGEGAAKWYAFEAGKTSVKVSDEADKIILVRMDPSKEVPSWAAKWNQSEDMDIQAGKTLTFKNWDKGTDGKSQFEWE